MPFEREVERQKAENMIQHSILQPLSNAEKILRTKELAHEELHEVAKAFDKMVDSLRHLPVFSELAGDSLVPHMRAFVDQVGFLISKDYTQEELDQMPSDIYERVSVAQTKRANLLRNIAKKYKL